MLARCPRLLAAFAAVVAGSVLLAGCCSAPPYRGLVKPVPQMSVLSPELQNLTDNAVETYLRAEAHPAFPTVLAVARLTTETAFDYKTGDQQTTIRLALQDQNELRGWRDLVESRTEPGFGLISQVQFVNPLLLEGPPTLKSLRDAAALLHAPLLLVYVDSADSDVGLNDAAMLYWTIFGLFCVPGHTIGYYSVCQGLLVDTRSGVILAAVEGQARREENTLPTAVDVATPRIKRQAELAAISELQANCRLALVSLARRPAPGQ